MALPLVTCYWLRRKLVDGVKNIRIIDGKDHLVGPLLRVKLPGFIAGNLAKVSVMVIW